MSENSRLPLKLVIPQSEDFRQPDHQHGSPKEFGEMTPEIREKLGGQVEDVYQYFQASFDEFPHVPGVARIVLKPKAIAKSHRPIELFQKSLCSVVGVGVLGEVLLSVTPASLHSLSSQIENLETRKGIANLSAIQRIEPYTAGDALRAPGSADIVQRVRNGTETLKIRLFNHGDDPLNGAVDSAFTVRLRMLGLNEPERLNYGPRVRVFRVKSIEEDMIEPLSRFVGTQSIGTFTTYRIHRAAARTLGFLSPDSFPLPISGIEYPTIGIIDTGIDPSNVLLSRWVVDREFYVAESEREYDHGTFVAGLAVHASRLNKHPGFTSESSRLLDVVALPKNGGLSEDELVAILEDVLPKYPDINVWNLSLSCDEPCAQQSFAELSMALDALQDKYQTMFVVAVGNHMQKPLRGWPVTEIGDADRVAPPADSVRALSIGSLAHLERHSSKVQIGQPSPFSRHGPGPVYIPKPEVVHYGGNCDENGSCAQTGIISTSSLNQLTEDIGTSFAVPMVATTLANLDSSLLGSASRNLKKALLIHSAVCGSERNSVREFQYSGFGVPGKLEDILTCEPWSVTLIFETELVPGLEFERTAFPIPVCLRKPNGDVTGEILMTLVYEPPLDPAFGAEYCRSNVDVSLGTYDVRPSGKRTHKKQVPLEPSDTQEMYESSLVEQGFKWSPVKVYRRAITRGVKGENWRLKVTVNHRSGHESSKPQTFALIVTIRDPDRKRPVYNDAVTLMQQTGWITTDLQIKPRVRTRI